MLRPIADYFRTSKEELEKVTWPSKQETLRYSVLIVLGSVAAAVFFGALDLGLGKVVQAVINARTQQTAPAEQPLEAPTTGTEDASAAPTDIQIRPNIEAVDPSGNKVNLDVQTIPLAPSNP